MHAWQSSQNWKPLLTGLAAALAGYFLSTAGTAPPAGRKITPLSGSAGSPHAERSRDRQPEDSPEPARQDDQNLFGQGENYLALGVDANALGRFFARNEFGKWSEAQLEEYAKSLGRPGNERLGALYGSAWTVLAQRNPAKALSLLENCAPEIRSLYVRNAAAGALMSDPGLANEMLTLKAGESGSRDIEGIFAAAAISTDWISNLLKNRDILPKGFDEALTIQAIIAQVMPVSGIANYSGAEQAAVLQKIASSPLVSGRFLTGEIIPLIAQENSGAFFKDLSRTNFELLGAALPDLPENHRVEAAKAILSADLEKGTQTGIFTRAFRALPADEQKAQLRSLAGKVDLPTATGLAGPLGAQAVTEAVNFSFESQMAAADNRRTVMESAWRMENPEQRLAALTGAAGQWARTEPNTAANYILQSEFGSLRAAALEPVISSWANIDKAGLTDWLTALGESGKNHSLIEELSGTNPFVRSLNLIQQ